MSSKGKDIIANIIAGTIIVVGIVLILGAVCALLALPVWPLVGSYGKAFAIVIAVCALTVAVKFFWGKS